jgi:hypothetical protein
MISAVTVGVEGGALVFYGRNGKIACAFGVGAWQRCEFHHATDADLIEP